MVHCESAVGAGRVKMCRMIGVVAVLLPVVVFTVGSVAAQEPLSEDTRAKVLEQARKAMVRIELHLKAIPDEEGPGGMGETTSSQALDQQQKQVIRFKKPIQLMGVVISPREVFVPDTGVNPQRIDRWEVTDSQGKQYRAKHVAVLRDAPTLVLAPEDPQVQWVAAEFAKGEVKPTSTFTVVLADWAPLDLRWIMRAVHVVPVNRWDASDDSDPSVFWVVGSLATGSVATDPTTVGEAPAAANSLIFDSAGNLLGVGLADRITADRSVPPWRGDELAKAKRITIEELEQFERRLVEKASTTMYPIRIEFRRQRGGFQALPESELLGWAIGERLLVAPGEIYRQVAARVDKIMVRTGGSEVEAEFVGQASDFSLILLKLPDSSAAFPAYADLSQAGTLHTYRPNLVLTIARKYGENDLRPHFTRSLGLEYGYKNRTSPRFTPAPYIGSLVFDLEERPIGMFLRARRPIEELDVIQTLARQGTASNISSVEFYELSVMKELARDPGAVVDRRVVRRDEKDQDRRAWLGVECSPLSKDLAESLGCRKESKDGAVGMMVNQVYAGSPAERLGLRSGDVLLSLEVEDRDQPVLLAMPRGRGQGEQFNAGEGQAGRSPWPPQGNFLNGVLSLIGEGTELGLAYWRDGQLQNTRFTVEMAPPDQDSAAQFKDEQLGITVKEVTYEVRAALRLKEGDGGVVVSKVESGTPAGRARINPNDIITAADGEPIDSPAKFEEIVNAAKEQKKDQIRLTVVDRGRSRFADLKLNP